MTDAHSSPEATLKALVMGAGDPAVLDLQTVLAQVANVPIVVHVLEGLARAGAREQAVLVTPEAEGEMRAALDANGWSAVRVLTVAARAGWIDTAASFVGHDPCIVHLGDGLLGSGLPPLSTLVVAPGSPTLVLAYPRRGQADGTRLAHRRLLRLASGLDGPPDDFGVAGVHVFRARAFAAGVDLMGSVSRPLSALDVARAVAEGDRGASVELVQDWQRYTGRAADLLELNRIALERLDSGSSCEDRPGCILQGRVSIHPTARIESTVVRGPVIVGPGAIVIDAYLGPYTAIGAGVRVEGAEVEHSVIHAGASVMHLGKRLEDSVVGRGSKIFRDFSLPRALRLNVGDEVEVALC